MRLRRAVYFLTLGVALRLDIVYNLPCMDIKKYISAYREPYDNALAELGALMDRLEELDIERDGLVTRIGEVQEGALGLAPLVKENPVESHPELFPDLSEVGGADLGLTDAIRRVLANSAPKRLTPVGVRTGLAAIGFQTQSKNILPSIHTVLKRLEKNKEIASKTEENGRTWYVWNGPTHTPPSRILPMSSLFRRTVPTMEEAVESERKRAEGRAAMAKAKKQTDLRTETEKRAGLELSDSEKKKRQEAAGKLYNVQKRD